jgi:oligopeptide transport system substrate-binding protein
MRRSRAGLTAVAVTAVASLVLAGCSQQSNQSAPDNTAPAVGFPETEPFPETPGKPGGVFRLGIVEPTAIDPFNAQESEGIGVAEAIFTGLVQVEPDGEVVPGAATDWSANEDCSVWTFNLAEGATFHNGEPVDAASFKRGWERAGAPSSGSEVSYHLDAIQGYTEFQAGSAAELTGVDAGNPNQLVVTLAQPNCEFELRTNHPVYSPAPAAVGATTDTAYTDAPIGNGPFRIDGAWQHDRGIRLVRFDQYNLGAPANLDAVEYTILPSANAAQLEYDGFVNGQFDWARMPPTLLAQARSTYEPEGKWISKKTNGMNYLTVAGTKPPLDNPDARKAISLAIDRNAIVQGILQGSSAPASTLVPALFPGAYQEGVCDVCRYDPEEAKRLAESAGLTPGTELSFQFNTGGGHEEWTAAVRQQLEQNLGLKVNYSGIPFTDLLNNEASPDASGIFRSAWGADYPTPGNFLIPLLATSSIGAGPTEPVTGNNYGRYSNPEFDDLVARASASRDEAERNELWKQAEQVAIGEDLALIPLWARQQYRLVDSVKFGNTNMNFNENPTLESITLK